MEPPEEPPSTSHLFSASEAEQIRAEVDRVVSSGALKIPARRARLLQYLVNRTLKGEANEISEYAIALDVFERPPSFDPKTDATVRAEVSRLRQHLTNYYAARNGDAPVAIALPARSYIPSFALRSAPETAKRRGIRVWIVAACAAAAAVAVAGWLLLGPRSGAPPALSLAALPISITPATAGVTSISPDLAEIYYGPLARTPGLSLLDWTMLRPYKGVDAVAKARKALPAAMLLQTVIDARDGAVTARLTLLQSNDGSVIWTQTFPLPDPSNPDKTLLAVVAHSLMPVLETKFNRHVYELRNGTSLPSPCLQKRPLARFLRAKVPLEIQQETSDARSSDTKIGFSIGGQSVFAGSTILVSEGAPLEMKLPAIAQFSQDTCVLTSEEGSLPVFDSSCAVPARGSNWLKFHYQCTGAAWPIDIGGLANSQQLWNEDRVPSGARIVAGLPFLLPDGKFMDWKGDAAAAGSARPVSVTIPVNRPSISRAYFLLNTEWGQSGPQSFLSLEFAGDKGAHFVKPLIGGVDVRDYHHGIYVNTINGTSSRLAYALTNADAIDVVEVDLPPDFRDQTLESITLRDTGRHNFERAILRAVTVQ